MQCHRSRSRQQVDDDTLHGHIKASAQALGPIRSVDLNQAVTEAFEFPFSSSFAHISCYTCTGKIKRIHKTHRGVPAAPPDARFPAK